MEQDVRVACREFRDEDPVLGGPASDLVVSEVAVEYGRIGSFASDQGVIATAAAKDVVAGVAEQPVIAASRSASPASVSLPSPP